MIEELGAPVQTEDQLKAITQDAKLAAKLLRWIGKAEDLLKERKKDYEKIVKKDLPEKMLAIQMESFSLGDGTQIKINDFMSGSLPKSEPKRSDAIKYLFELNAEGLLKPSVKIQLAVGEEDIAKRALKACKNICSNKKKRDALIKAGISMEDIEALKIFNQRGVVNHDVHHSTLAAKDRDWETNIFTSL